MTPKELIEQARLYQCEGCALFYAQLADALEASEAAREKWKSACDKSDDRWVAATDRAALANQERDAAIARAEKAERIPIPPSLTEGLTWKDLCVCLLCSHTFFGPEPCPYCRAEKTEKNP